MNAYTEVDCIYFNIGKWTSFARYLSDGSIKTGTYLGDPPYQSFSSKQYPKALKQYHAAEHKVYNAFSYNIRQASEDSSITQLQAYIPNLKEAMSAPEFSLFCGSTIFIASAVLLFIACLPNLFRFYNTEWLFMLPWLGLSLLIAYALSVVLQKTFYLAKPNEKQIRLALEALKEALNERNLD